MPDINSFAPVQSASQKILTEVSSGKSKLFTINYRVVDGKEIEEILVRGLLYEEIIFTHIVDNIDDLKHLFSPNLEYTLKNPVTGKIQNETVPQNIVVIQYQIPSHEVGKYIHKDAAIQRSIMEKLVRKNILPDAKIHTHAEAMEFRRAAANSRNTNSCQR